MNPIPLEKGTSSRSVISCFFLLLFSHLAGASETLVLGDNDTYPVEGRYLELLEDKTGELSLEDLLNQKHVFESLTEPIPNLGAVRTVFWVRFTLDNPKPVDREWVMSFELPHFSSIITHSPKLDGGFEVLRRGLVEAAPGKPVTHPHHIVKITTYAEHSDTWYLRLATSGPTQIPLRLQTHEAFAAREIKVNAIYGAYLGGLLVMVLYNLFLFLGAGEKVYIYYCLFLLSSGMMWLSSTGLLFIKLWPENSVLAGLDLFALCLFTILASTVFCMSFLHTKIHCPRIHKLLMGTVLGVILVCLIYLYSMEWGILLLVIVGNACMACLVAAGFISWRKGYQPARYYLISWVPIILVSSQLALEKGGFIPRYSLDQFQGMGGSMLEMILISFALADRINMVKRQREEAQNRAIEAQRALNQDLEELVEKRTAALDEALTIQKVQHQELAVKHQELGNAQEHMIRQASMASMGTLSAGIAHELRNPLNFINNFAEIMIDLSREAEQNHSQGNPTLQEILVDLGENARLTAKYGERAEFIVKAMVDWVGQGGHWQAVSFNQFVEHCLEVSIYGRKPKSLTIEREWDDRIEKALVLPKQLSRVITQLVVNALEAVQDRQSLNEPGYQALVKIQTRKQHNAVSLMIWDNGTGICQEHLNCIFTPFFTTKLKDTHVGLGLSMAYDAVVKQHKGAISVESKSGDFTKFLVSLPLKESVEEPVEGS